MLRLIAFISVFSFTALVLAQAPPPDVKFTPLFNGKDLTGWINTNGASSTWFVKDEVLITTGQPIALLRSEKQYENFILEMEWMHVQEKGMANSGLFVWGDALPGVGSPFARGIEVQILINFETDWATSHGDVFSVQAAKCVPDRPHPKGYARCLPSERRVKGAKEWNHYKVIANDGVIKLHVNGKEVSGVSQCSPRKGYLCLESEGSECHFRNIKIHELPSKNLKQDQIATIDEGFRSIVDGLSLKGWTSEDKSWKVQGGVLKGASGQLNLDQTLSEGVLQFDWRLTGKDVKPLRLEVDGKPVEVPGKAGWQRKQIDAKGKLAILGQPGLELTNVYFKKK